MKLKGELSRLIQLLQSVFLQNVVRIYKRYCSWAVRDLVQSALSQNVVRTYRWGSSQSDKSDSCGDGIDIDYEMQCARRIISEQSTYHAGLCCRLNRSAEINFTLAPYRLSYRNKPGLPVTCVQIARSSSSGNYDIQRYYRILTPSSEKRLNALLDHGGWIVNNTVMWKRFKKDELQNPYSHHVTHCIYNYSFSPNSIEMPISGLGSIPAFGIPGESSTESAWFQKISHAFIIPDNEQRKIMHYLYNKVFLTEALLDAQAMLKEYFPDDNYSLSIEYEDCPGNFNEDRIFDKSGIQKLNLTVMTALDPGTAMFKLSQFDEKWWQEYLQQSPENWEGLHFMVNLELL